MSKLPDSSTPEHRVIKQFAWRMLAWTHVFVLLMAMQVLTMPSGFADSLDQVQVLGTVMGNKPSSSYAIIAIGNEEASHFKKGQSVLPGYILHKILEDKIVLKHGDKTIKIKIGVPFSAEDFKVESSLPPNYDQIAPADIPPANIPQAPDMTPQQSFTPPDSPANPASQADEQP